MEKKLRDWVRPGVELVRARPFRFTKVFMSEDFPTFDFPANATSGTVSGGIIITLKRTLYKIR
jgi:hypothetical protein